MRRFTDHHEQTYNNIFSGIAVGIVQKVVAVFVGFR